MSEAEIRGWLIGRLPEGWFAGPPEVEIDGEEVLVIGKLAAPLPAAGSGSEAGRIAGQGGLAVVMDACMMTTHRRVRPDDRGPKGA